MQVKGLGAVGLWGFFLSAEFGLGDSWLDFCGAWILVWSTGQGGVCCPKFFAAARQASGYVSKLNLVWCRHFKLEFWLSLRHTRCLLSKGCFGVVVSVQGEEFLGPAAPRYLWVSFSYLLYESNICLIRACSFMYIELDVLMQPRDTVCGVKAQ
jgi:hypothetical protein